jgi:cytochrome b561
MRSTSIHASASTRPTQAVAEHYNWQARLLHWVVALLIIGMLGLGFFLENIPRNTPERAFYVNLHKSFGVLVLGLVLVRWLWRITHRSPPLPADMPWWETLAATWTHKLLYLCMFLQPLSGYLASSFNKYGVKFFGLPLPQWGWEDKALRSFFIEIHGVVAIVLLLLICLHVLGALKHLLLDKDRIFQRMLPWRARPLQQGRADPKRRSTGEPAR